jgi:hypothetical protein
VQQTTPAIVLCGLGLSKEWGNQISSFFQTQKWLHPVKSAGS